MSQERSIADVVNSWSTIIEEQLRVLTSQARSLLEWQAELEVTGKKVMF
jgi:hypothetical protein